MLLLLPLFFPLALDFLSTTYFLILPSHSLPSVKWKSKDFRKKRGTLRMRTVTSTERREIARRNFVRLLAEATRREDYPRGKELLGDARDARIFFFLREIRGAHISFRKKIPSRRIPRQVSCKHRSRITFILSSLFFNLNILIVLQC